MMLMFVLCRSVFIVFVRCFRCVVCCFLFVVDGWSLVFVCCEVSVVCCLLFVVFSRCSLFVVVVPYACCCCLLCCLLIGFVFCL